MMCLFSSQARRSLTRTPRSPSRSSRSSSASWATSSCSSASQRSLLASKLSVPLPCLPVLTDSRLPSPQMISFAPLLDFTVKTVAEVVNLCVFGRVGQKPDGYFYGEGA